MKVWEKLFGIAGGVRPAPELASAIKRPAARDSWEAIRDRAKLNSQKYDTAFEFIPANGRSIWPTISMDGSKRTGGLMPFDNAFWAVPPHSSDAAQSLSGVKGYITLLPWRWPVVLNKSQKEVMQNNNSGMHSALFVDNSQKAVHPKESTQLSSAGISGTGERPA